MRLTDTGDEYFDVTTMSVGTSLASSSSAGLGEARKRLGARWKTRGCDCYIDECMDRSIKK